MAGTPKRCGRAGYKAKRLRYQTGRNKERNAELRQLRHEVNVEQQKVRTDKKTKLFESVCSMFDLDSKGKYALKRLVGTINISRLTSVLEKTIVGQPWYDARIENLSENAQSLIKDTKLRVFL